MDPHRILVTGASGAVGSSAVRALRERGHVVRGFDRAPSRDAGDHRIGDLLDLAALGAAVEGVDTVLHLAGVADRQDFARELVPNNIVGTQHVLEAARLAGVARFVYASSIRVVGGLDWERGTIGLDAGLVPGDHYGVSKATGELLARMYAERFGLSVISARLGWFVRNLEEARLFETLSVAKRIYLSHRDAERFFVRAVEAASVGYAALFVTSRSTAFELGPTRTALGYEPEDEWPAGSSWSEEAPFASPAWGASLLPERPR